MTITASSAWAALAAHQQAMANSHLKDLFASDPQRVQALSLSFDGLYYDFSKQRLTAETLGLLTALASS